MALPLLIPVALGTIAGWRFGSAIETKVRGFFSKAPGASAVALDATLPKDMRAEVESLLAHVKDPGLLETAAAYYKAHGFPTAANTLAARAAFFERG